MESQLSKVEVIKQAIKQVMEEVRSSDTKSSSDDGDGDGHVDVEDDNHHRLLSKLMSQLEKLEADPEINTEELIDDEKTNTNIKKSRLEQEEEEEEEEEILAKELKKLKRQNLITHCLLSVMIVLTVVWQISEVSIVLKLKDGVNNPFRSIGNIFKRMITAPLPKPNANEEETESSITNNLIDSSRIGDLKIPELPHVDLPNSSHTWFLKDGN